MYELIFTIKDPHLHKQHTGSIPQILTQYHRLHPDISKCLIHPSSTHPFINHPPIIHPFTHPSSIHSSLYPLSTHQHSSNHHPFIHQSSIIPPLSIHPFIHHPPIIIHLSTIHHPPIIHLSLHLSIFQHHRSCCKTTKLNCKLQLQFFFTNGMTLQNVIANVHSSTQAVDLYLWQSNEGCTEMSSQILHFGRGPWGSNEHGSELAQWPTAVSSYTCGSRLWLWPAGAELTGNTATLCPQ